MDNFTAITSAHIWVFDHQKALDFYVGKLGLEVKSDFSQGGYRWLTVGVAGTQGVEIQLDVPGPPMVDEKSAEQIRELVKKGATGVVMALRSDDCVATYERLRAQGVEFTMPATDHGYGIDCALKDPFGNQLRILQPKGR